MNITSAQYTKDDKGENYAIKIVVGDKIYHVPPSEGNTDYQEILKQVEEGKLTIKDAD
tara:strand:+ start:359 stop:532 length:174 start_codon:yes stop_codon:yes gene_type:complete